MQLNSNHQSYFQNNNTVELNASHRRRGAPTPLSLWRPRGSVAQQALTISKPPTLTIATAGAGQQRTHIVSLHQHNSPTTLSNAALSPTSDRLLLLARSTWLLAWLRATTFEEAVDALSRRCPVWALQDVLQSEAGETLLLQLLRACAWSPVSRSRRDLVCLFEALMKVPRSVLLPKALSRAAHVAVLTECLRRFTTCDCEDVAQAASRLLHGNNIQ
eukprot:PhM_4_TR5120/c0_g1_i1/m.87468